MNKTLKFILFTSVLVITASFFASSFPDGLEFIAEKLGFLHKGIAGSGLMKDYSVSFLGENGLSTAISGLLGIGLIMGIFTLITKFLTIKKTEN